MRVWRGRRAEWKRSVQKSESTEAPPRSAGCISCVFSASFSLTLSAQPRLREQGEILTGNWKGVVGGTLNFITSHSERANRRDERKEITKGRNSLYLCVGMGGTISPACYMCSAHFHHTVFPDGEEAGRGGPPGPGAAEPFE